MKKYDMISSFAKAAWKTDVISDASFTVAGRNVKGIVDRIRSWKKDRDQMVSAYNIQDI